MELLVNLRLCVLSLRTTLDEKDRKKKNKLLKF